MTWVGPWSGPWPGEWEGPSDSEPQVVHALGAVSLALVGGAEIDAQFALPVEVEPVGSGGDDGVSPQARKWLRERYKQPTEQTQGSQEVRRQTHNLDIGGSSPPPATNVERPDIRPLIEQATAAAREVLAERRREEDARREANNRRAIALVMALLDD